MSTKVLITNALQIGASVVSSITNIILGIVISVVAKYVLRPSTIPGEHIFIFWGVLISNFINSAIIPLLLNANVYGMQFVSYLKFLNFMDFNNLSIFGDFNADWYALISPYYITMIIIASFISPIIGLAVLSLQRCLKNRKIENAC
jgi:hypothetical protein